MQKVTVQSLLMKDEDYEHDQAEKCPIAQRNDTI